MIPTTSGWVQADELGFTLMHEHVAVFSPGIVQAFPFLFDQAAIIRKCTADLAAAKLAGVDTIVDCTTADLGRDPELILEAARAANIRVVLATGIHRAPPPYFRPASDRQSTNRGADDAANVFIHEIEQGVGTSRIPAGIIKVASHEYITPEQEIILRGAARASLATGVPITTHTYAPARTGLLQIAILRDEGVPLERVAIGHSITHDFKYLGELYEAGCFVSWDSYLYTAVLPPDRRDAATEALHRLLVQGHSEKTVLGHDFYSYSDYLLPQDEDMTYIPRVVLPRLRQLGSHEHDLKMITSGAPARLLESGRGPADQFQS